MRNNKNIRGGLALLSSLVLAACQSMPPQPVPVASAPPAACGPDFARAADELVLPPTTAPRDLKTAKGSPHRYASEIPVNGGIDDIGRWGEAAPGWSAWRLRMHSEGARSISVHLQPLRLPPRAELWVCSPSGMRHGPFREAGMRDGELWSPIVKGQEIWIEVLLPGPRRSAVELRIAEVFGGFR